MDELNKVLLALYASSREVPLDQFHEEALKLLKTALRFDSAIWGTGSITTRGLSYHSVHLHNEPDDLAVQYQEIKEEDDAVFQLLSDGPSTTRRFHAPALFRGRAKSGIRAYVARVRHHNYIVASERNPDTDWAQWIALYRARPEDEYSEQDHRLLTFLAPHLREALKNNCVLHMERSMAGPRGYCTAIADAKGVLYHAECGFRELIQVEWPHSSVEKLPAELIERTSNNSHRYTGDSVVISVRWVKSLMFLKAREKVAADSLTERERAVVQQVRQGLNYKAIARAMGLAPTTVRNHIQNIHRKLGAHTNAELAGHLPAD